MAGDIEHIWN